MQEYKLFLGEFKADNFLDMSKHITETYGKQGYKLFASQVIEPAYASADKLQVVGFRIVMTFVKETPDPQDVCGDGVEAIQRHRGRPKKETEPVSPPVA